MVQRQPIVVKVTMVNMVTQQFLSWITLTDGQADRYRQPACKYDSHIWAVDTQMTYNPFSFFLLWYVWLYKALSFYFGWDSDKFNIQYAHVCECCAGENKVGCTPRKQKAWRKCQKWVVFCSGILHTGEMWSMQHETRWDMFYGYRTTYLLLQLHCCFTGKVSHN
jgi:hypothetical protein